jgi:hypothetical protein
MCVMMHSDADAFNLCLIIVLVICARRLIKDASGMMDMVTVTDRPGLRVTSSSLL